MSSKELGKELESLFAKRWSFIFATSKKVAERLVPDGTLKGVGSLTASPAVKMGLVMSLQLQDEEKFWDVIGLTLREVRDVEQFEAHRALISAHGSQEEKEEFDRLRKAIQDASMAVKIAEKDERINELLGGKEVSEEARKFLRGRNYDMATNWHCQLKLAAATTDPAIVVAVVDESQNQRGGSRYTDIVSVWHNGQTASKEFRWRGSSQCDDDYSIRVTSIGEVTIRRDGQTTIVSVELVNANRSWREFFAFQPAATAVFADPQAEISWLEDEIKSKKRYIRQLEAKYHEYYFAVGESVGRQIGLAREELRELENELLLQKWYEEFLLG